MKSPLSVPALCALLATANGAGAATGLPPFRVDPALLGAPPAPRPPQVVSPAPVPPVLTAPPATLPLQPSGTSPQPQAPTPTAPAPPVAVPLIAPPVPQGAALVPPEPPEIRPPQPGEEGLALKLTPALTPLSSTPDEDTPIFVSAMRIQGQYADHVEAEEDVELRKRGLRVNADHLRYSEREDRLQAHGNVRLQGVEGVVKGSELNLKLADQTGYMQSPAYAILAENAHGTGSRLTFLGPDRYAIDDASYTTCAIGREDWWVRAANLEIGQAENEGVGRHARLEFQGVPLLYTPYISFPLKQERKSGVLAPSFGTTGTSGVEFTVPYYWNIAPNYDATFYPRYMSKRGLQIGGEFRYLQPDYAGELAAEWLADDATQTTRTSYRIHHNHDFGGGLSGHVHVERVSDNNYFRDLSALVAATSTVTLPANASLTYAQGPWTASLAMQKFQILQDPANPIVAPYDRLPQAVGIYNKLNAFGMLDVRALGEYVRFDHPSLVSGARFTAYPAVSLPLTNAWGYLVPKLGLNYRRYALSGNTTGYADKTLTLPILSLDGGVTFERSTAYFGRDFTQTLEPRLFYLYVPYKDQSTIPNFDSAEPDFNFAQIFAENRFSGGDKISDANQVTFALSTRLFEPDTGTQRLHAMIGQRLFFSTPRVTLTPATPAPTRKVSDFLAVIGGRISQAWWADAGWQYNPDTALTERYKFSARYNPEPGKVANFGYRYDRGRLHNVDVSGQWPFSRDWQGLGRWSYSLQDGRTLEALAGVEYRAGCWALRLVGQRFQTAERKQSNAVFIQLELTGLTSLGTNPLNVLKQNIGGYTHTAPRLEPINLDQF